MSGADNVGQVQDCANQRAAYKPKLNGNGKPTNLGVGEVPFSRECGHDG